MSKKSKKPTKAEFIPADPDSPDENVKLPRQVRLAVERAEDIVAGKQPRPVENNAASAKRVTDAKIDVVLERWDQGKLSVFDPDFGIIIELAREGARLTKAHRQKAQTISMAAAIQRMRVLIQAVMELPPGLRRHLTGKKTIEWLVKAIKEKLGLQVSEDTVRHDIRLLRPFLRVVQDGNIRPPGQPRSTPELEERTRLEQEAGRRAVARAEANPDLPKAFSDPATIFENS